MNDNVKIKAEELIRTILDSDEYRNYEHYRQCLSENPELRDRVRTFRKTRVDVSYGGQSSREISDLLTSQYADILNNTIAAGYLNAELEVCRMIQNVNAIITGGLQLDLDFL